MAGWWERNISEPGKLPLLLCFAAFITTFLATRTITRLIRAGRGPFKNNVSEGGVHIHHAIPGIILLVVGSLLAVSPATDSPWREIAAVAVGIGMSLVLDEFALILHLDDVYWSAEGRVSVEMVSLAVASMGLVLIGGVPFGVEDIGDGELSVRLGAIVTMVINVALVLVNVVKGKSRLALFAAFVPVVSWTGAIRLARPGSRWARRYDDAKLAKATERVKRFDARWEPITTKLSNLVAGDVSPPEHADHVRPRRIAESVRRDRAGRRERAGADEAALPRSPRGAATAAPATGGSAARARLAVLDRRPELRYRLPCPASRRAAARNA